MGSLTTCFRKIGEAPSAADKDAIIARARELRAGGMAIDAAALQAARELLEDVRVDLKSMAEPKAPKASVHPKTVMGSELLALVSQRMGGLDPAWLSEFSTRTETGRKDKAGKPIIQWRNPPIPGVGLLFRRGGTQDLQAIAEMLEQDGYLEPGAVERDYKAAGEAAKDMIRAALNRKVVERQDTLIDAAQARMDAEREAYYAELDAESAREAEAERAAIMAKSGTARMELQKLDDDDLDIDFAPLERQNTPEEVAAGMRSMGFTEQEIADELASRQDARATAQAGPAEAGQDGPQDAPAAAGAGEDAQGNRAEAGAEQGLTLSAQTPQDLQAKADREAIAAKADAAEQKRLADKAKADAQRDEFTLTGSDRPADVAAAAGQGGLFDTSTQPVEKATANRPDPKQGDRFTDRDGKPWQVWSFRHGVVEAHPVVDGKPQVNADTREYWAIDRGAMERFPDRRTDFNPVETAAPKSAFADNKAFTQSDMDKAREILRKKLRQFNSGIDPEMMQAGITLAGGHIEAGARTFAKFVRAMVEDLGEAVRPYLKSWYAAVSFDPRAQAFAPDMTPVAELATIDIDAIGKEPSDVPSPDAGVERDRADAADQARTMGDTVPAGAGATAPGAAARGSRSGSAGRRPANDPGVLAGGTLPAGERGDQRVPGADRAGLPEEFPAGPGGPERSGDGGERGIPPQHLAAGAVETAAGAGLSHDQRAAAQRAADAIPVVPGDAENIAATLPYLLSGQQEDVGKAEARFAQPHGYGMMFTNGTGTGKTYLALGAIKRFARQGKTNILIVVPGDKIAADWADSAKALSLDVTPLKSTKDAGSGIVVTTYANLGDNAAVAGRNWDLVVADEAQLLSSNKDGDPTKALTALRAITHHPRGAYARYEMLHAADIQRLSDLTERINSNVKIMNSPDTMDEVLVSLRDENQKLEARQSALSRTLDAARKAVEADVKARQGASRARVLMLSATPFAYEKSVDLAEGYLFDYKDGYPYDETSNRYNQPNPREYFFMTHFGYRMRVNKLTEPDDPKLDRGLLQRQFNGWLKKRGVLSQRTLDVPADYDRRFVLVESAAGRRIDDALNWVSEKSRQEGEANRGAGKGTESTGWASLNSVLTHELYGPDGFRVRRYLLEAIKAKEVIPHIREHMAMGRKVVVFHDFNKGGSRNPFALDGVPQSVIDAALGTEGSEGDAARKAQQYNEALAEFKAEFPDLTGGDLLADLISPIERFKRDLPGVLLVNGLEKKPDILARYKTFNDDAAGPQVMLVQSSKDAGWSGHDTTGKHQRVLFNLGLPTKPTTAIQQEGRIYRTGQVSDAMQRYLNTGTTWERTAFAQTIAKRASAAENLAAGESARALRDAFISAFEESDDYRAGHEGEGKGGKARDRFIDTVTTEWDRAKSFYRGTQKKNSRTKAEEGEDYFATPEPVGLKMVQWADLRGGESALEPSGGHGAIARWIPETVKGTAIEPSMALRSRMALVFQGDIKPGTFEDHHIVNKYHGVTMNPPFGTAGRTAIDHAAKATQHLIEGGRVVALIPTGPAADAKFEKWLYAQDAKGRPENPDLHLVADIRLPAVTFERAGTRVMTRVVVIEKGKTAPQMISRDLSDITSIEELFDRLEDLQVPPRAAPQQSAAAAIPASSPAGRADARAQAQAEKEQAQESGADIAARLGLRVVEHVTKNGAGKTLRGVIRMDLTPAQAQEVDAYTFRKDGGQFIRLEHMAEMVRKHPPPGTVAAEERAVYAVNEPAGTDAPLDLFPESLEGLQALPAQPRAGAPGKRRPAAAWDAQPAAGVPAPNTFAEREDPQFPGLYHYSAQLVAVGQRELPVAAVKTWQDAASALASLRRYAVEHFDVLVTDKDGKPLAVVGSFKGAQAQTSVYPSTLLAEALRIKDAAKAWGVHNHPSGNEKLSRADEMLSNAIGNAFSPSSVEWMGISAVGGDRFSAYDGVRFTDGKVIDGAAKATVPVVERTITPGNVGMPVLDSPQKAKDVAATVGAGRSGVLFTDQQRRVTAFVPLESAHAAELRKDGRFDRLINSASNAGAAAGIIVNQAGVYDARTLENIASALRLADIRVLDAIDPARGTSAAEKGVEPRGNMPVLSQLPRARRGTGPGSDISTLKPHIDGITAKLQGLRAPVEVVRTVFDLPQDIVSSLRSMNAMGTTRGLRMPDGRVYLVADKLRNQAEAEFVLFHELFGHEGIRALLDEEAYARELTRLKLANPALAAEANRWFAAYGADQIAARVERGMSVPEARKVVRLLAIEEALSDRAGLNEPLKGWRALMAVVQKALRAIGAEDLANWLEGKTQAETMALLAGARRAITEGVAHVTRQDATAAASREAPIWYSALLAEVSKSPMKAGNAAAWGQYVDALTKRGAIKADELEWTGLKDWLALQTGKITKDQISEYLSGNAVRVTETVLTDNERARLPAGWEVRPASRYADDTEYAYVLTDDQGEIRGAGDTQAAAIEDGWDPDERDDNPTKYSNYTLPGGTNYREVLLTLPPAGEKSYTIVVDGKGPPRYKFAGKVYDSAIEAGKAEQAARSKEYKSNHWDQPNVLAHIRVNDRTDADGKRVLFVEEIQSDWGQEGKKRGFTDPTKPIAVFDKETGAVVARFADEVEAARDVIARGEERFDWKDAQGKAPVAPFVTKTDAWVSLALKRIIHMAATEGYDRVAFVNGEQSAERYDLSKHIDSMDVRKIDNGKLMIYANKNNEQVLTKMTEPDGLADVIGKDMANRVLADIDAGRPTQYRGLDLRTGGEGMKAFYDRIIPLAARDVLRRLGVSEHALGGKAVAPKMDRNGGLIDAKAIRDLALSQAFKDKGFKGLAPDVKRLVQSHMLALAKDRQVLQSVVSSVPVDVVNVLRAKQLSPEMFFHDPSMLVDDLAAKLGADVAAQIDVASALVSAAASVAAEAPAMGPIRGRGVSLERGATVGTGLHKDILAQIEIPGIGAQPGFSVTPAMREKAAGGMPLFSRRDAAPAVAPAVAVTRDENGTPTEFVGPRVVLAFPQETERFEVIPEPGQQILSYAIMPTEGFDSLGFVELLVENGRPVSLLDIEVNAYGRQLGTGSAVIETLLAADPHAELHISNIVESARGFWSRMGVPEQNRAPGEAYDGILNWQTFAQAQDARTAPGVGRRTAARLAAEPDRGGQGPDRGGAGNPQGDGRGASDLPALSRQPEPGWLMPGMSRWDNYRYKLQDKQIDLKRARDAIAASRELDDQVDAYLQEELFHGRAAKRTEDFINHELDPLLKDAKARGLTLESIDEYLHARHAKEANALIAERDPEMQDGGSGLTNEEAAAYLSGLDDKRRADLEAVAAKVDAIISRTRAMMVNYQLEGQATVDGWAAMFKHYVPLMREDHEMGAGLGTGQGFSIKGRESKHRTGSTSKVIDILANIAMQRERTIVRGEKNRVAVALAGLAVINPNPEVWSFGPITERKYNERTGLVQVQIKGGWKNADNVLVAKIADEDGIVHERGIVFNERNERALRMAQALKNLDAAQLEGWMGAAAKATRWLASVNTQYNPIFGVVNLTRDVQGAALNLSTTAIKGKEAEVLKLTLPALAGVYRDTRAARKDKTPASQWSQLWEEFQREGGQTGFRAMFQTSSDRADAIRASLDPQAWMRSGLGRVVTANGALSLPAGWMQKGGDWVFDWLSDYNLAMENGVRMAAYKVALDAGLSKQRAASLAKNLTVNFNRKGQVAQQAGALYAFFNASVQGTARLAETLTGPTGRKIIAGGVLLGALQALALMAAGYDDDEPPQFVRERNLIIPLDWVNKAGGPNLSRKYVTIPMPLGFHVLVNMGRIPVEYAASGFKNGGKRTMQVLGMLADSFNPIGNAGLSWQTVTPTAADPVVALLENRDGSGRPIARQAHNQITPGHALARDTASSWSKWMSRVINTMTGGSEYRAGFVSPTPDQIDYLIGQVTGGVGRELTKAEQFASSLVTGEELPPHKIPLLGRFYGDLNATSAEASRYYDNQLRMNSHEAEIKGITRDFNDGSKNKTLTEEGARLVKEYIKKNPEADPDLIEQSNKAERAIAKLRKDKRAAIARGDKKEVKQIEAETLGEMKSFNLLIKNADKIAATPLERQPE